MPTANFQTREKGYSAALLNQLDNYFLAPKGLLGAEPGTVLGLLSSANTSRTGIELFGGTGKKQYFRLYWRNAQYCPQELAYSANEPITLCEGTEIANPYEEIIINPDDLGALTYTTGGSAGDIYKFSVKYNWTEHEKSMPLNEAEEIAALMNDWMLSYAAMLNKELVQRISSEYQAYPTAGGVADTGTLGGFGRGKWTNLNGVKTTGPIDFTAMDANGALYYSFMSNFQKLRLLNGIEQTPIVVHGLGALYDYVQSVAQGAFCCNDHGVDLATHAARFDMLNYYEGHRARNIPGFNQDTVVMWEPGAQVLLQPSDFNAPGQTINQYDHERRLITDPRTGLQFHYVRHLEKCASSGKLEMKHELYHKFKLYSKPTQADACDTDTNQTIVINLTKATPTEGYPIGNPTDGFTSGSYSSDSIQLASVVTGSPAATVAETTTFSIVAPTALTTADIASVAITATDGGSNTVSSTAASEVGSSSTETSNWTVDITYPAAATYSVTVTITFTSGATSVAKLISGVVVSA